MAVQILSDLHLEAPKSYDFYSTTPRAPYLALLGDIGQVAAHRAEFLDFLKLQLKQFCAVLFVPGNHEAYGSTWPKTIEILRAFEHDVHKDESLGHFVLLDRKIFQLPGTNVVILGCSLFSRVSAENEMVISYRLNDFSKTSDWDVAMHNEAHQRDLAWLNAQVESMEHLDVEIMIFSHWSPSLDSRAVDPKHAKSPITSAFSTDLSEEVCFKSEKVSVWAFGHTHYNCDFTLQRSDCAKELRLLANQRGYYFDQAAGFDGEKIIEV